VSVSGSAGATTLTTPQIPSHTHGLSIFKVYASPFQPQPVNPAPRGGNPTSLNLNSDATGGGGSHDHPLTISSSTFTGSAINLAVKYYDFIIATID
jgi:hypothetical protein